MLEWGDYLEDEMGLKVPVKSFKRDLNMSPGKP